MLPVECQTSVTGDVHTKQFKAGDTWVEVLGFQQTSCPPGAIELYDPRVKECSDGKATMVLSGVVREDDAWVVQEWKIEVMAPPAETPVGKGWLKPERRHGSIEQDR